MLFAAAHGYSIKQSGRFYMIPQDYRGDADPAALESRAIGQDWVANRIRAKKAIILLRTAGNPYPLRNPFTERAAAHESGLGTEPE